MVVSSETPSPPAVGVPVQALVGSCAAVVSINPCAVGTPVNRAGSAVAAAVCKAGRSVAAAVCKAGRSVDAAVCKAGIAVVAAFCKPWMQGSTPHEQAI